MAVTRPPPAAQRGRGRPRKFAAPSRAITLTLPEATIERLARIDGDLSHAIVRLAERYRPSRDREAPAVLVRFGRRAVISVKPSSALERRAGIELVPLPDGRALISFAQPVSIADLELTLVDALDDPGLAAEERQVFGFIHTILKDARQSSAITLLRRSIIVLEAVSATTPAASRGSGRSRGRS